MTNENTVWIDLENTPHVPFFNPFIKELQNRDFEVLVTARPRAQTVPLAEEYNFDFEVFGSGKTRRWKPAKALQLGRRAWDLRRYIRSKSPVLALSHGSRSQIITSLLMGIPTAVFMDYEHANQFLFQRADAVFYPDAVEDEIGRAENIHYFSALNEDLYVSSELKAVSGTPSSKRVNVKFRPPATFAHYHEGLSDDLLDAFSKRFERADDPVVVEFFPREEADVEQWEPVLNKGHVSFTVTGESVERAGVWLNEADLVIGGGGTMTREAAVAGVPSFSFFQGEKGAVDKVLMDEGRLNFIEEPKDVLDIPLKHNQKGLCRETGESVHDIIETLCEVFHID